MNLQGKSILITGASRGLGRALAGELGKKGGRLVLIARQSGPLAKVVQEVRQGGGIAYGIAADIADKTQTYPIAAQAAELAGPVDLLIHNASDLGEVPLRGLLDTDCETLGRVMETNVIGPFRLTKAVAGSMRLRGAGTVLTLSSDAAVEAYPHWGPYAASKAAADHLTRTWAAELGTGGVRFLSVDPGEMDTAMHAAAMPEADPTTLRSPAQVAERLVTLLEADRFNNGERVVLL